jgi:P27 family predicted phage terminase small subunit
MEAKNIKTITTGAETAPKSRALMPGSALITDVHQCLNVTGYDLLSPKAKGIYRKKCKELITVGKLMIQDLHQLILYAHSCDQYWLFDQVIREKGVLTELVDRNGKVRYEPNPAVKMRRDALSDILKIGYNFGFSSMDRKRLDIKAKDEVITTKDIIEKILYPKKGAKDVE